MGKNQEIKGAIHNRKKTIFGEPADISQALLHFSTEELFCYYIQVVMEGQDIDIRSILEEQIINFCRQNIV